MFVDTGKIVGVLGKEPPVMQKREELKIEKAREEWKKLISQDIQILAHSSPAEILRQMRNKKASWETR